MTEEKKPSLLDSLRKAQTAAPAPAAPAKPSLLAGVKTMIPRVAEAKPAQQQLNSLQSQALAKIAESKPVIPAAKPSLLGALATSQQAQTPTSEPTKPASPAAPTGSLLAAANRGVEKKAALDADYAYLHAELPTDIKELTERFDAMMCRDNGIDIMNLGMARAYVKKIMVMLKENPEFDNLIIDRDVHNIMAFVRKTREQAIDTINVKTEKAAKSAATKASKKNRFGSIEAIDFGGSMPVGITLEAMKDIEF